MKPTEFLLPGFFSFPHPFFLPFSGRYDRIEIRIPIPEKKKAVVSNTIMKNERWITIRDIDETQSGDETIEFTTRGVLRGNAEDYSLHFEELFGDGMKSKTVIRVKNKKCASIVRGGDISTEITVEAGKRHNCCYSTPYGDMMVGIFAREVFSGVDPEEGGELRLNYTVDFNGSFGSHKQMLIKVGKILPPC